MIFRLGIHRFSILDCVHRKNKKTGNKTTSDKGEKSLWIIDALNKCSFWAFEDGPDCPEPACPEFGLEPLLEDEELEPCCTIKEAHSVK
jgi:hypothetical protein